MNPLPIGEEEFKRYTVTILPEDGRKHMAIFGKSGVGKTTLMIGPLTEPLTAR